MSSKALLVLDDGRIFTGTPFGAIGQTLGEAVFSTGMSGYQETLTDPSYHRQIVIATAPQIGNTGWNHEDAESRGDKIWVAGYAVRDPSPMASNWRATGTLEDELVRQGVVGISGIDTRAVVRHLRSLGSMKAGVFSGAALAATSESGAASMDELLDRVRSQQSMLGADLAGQVSTGDGYVVETEGTQRFTVAAVDLGIKANTPRMMAERGIETHVLPATATLDDVRATGADGVFFSNGPGDPAATEGQVDLLEAVLKAGIPYFGICFGNQLFGRALGFGTYKLTYGHRGINQPVMDRTTGKVEVTAHNHGFAVEAPLDRATSTPYGEVTVSHVCLNDDVVEGLELRAPDGALKAFSVQYHPEAAAGPHDAAYLFDRFSTLLEGTC
jgi:carbamoyl-phosphate synthase small subunit